MTGFESFVGIDPWTALFTFCNMMITFAVLKKFLFKPVKKMIDDRQQEIDTMYADNSAASFIDNIAVEYRLDRSATRYVKVFYDRSTQDPLEGQLTQTGAGLVLRRKTDKLGELFLFRRKKE